MEGGKLTVPFLVALDPQLGHCSDVLLAFGPEGMKTEIELLLFYLYCLVARSIFMDSYSHQAKVLVIEA